MSEPASLEQLRLGTGIPASKREEILEQFSSLEPQLTRLPREGFDAELSVKDGDPDKARNPKQRVVLEVWARGSQRYVSTSTKPELHAALVEVRDDMRTTIRRALDRQRDRSRKR